MDVRGSFSRLKKKLKHPGSKRNPNQSGVDSGEERRDLSGSLSPPVPHVVAEGGHIREDKGSDTDEWQIRSTNRPPAPGVPKPVPVRGSNSGQEEIRGGVEGGKSGQRCLHPHSDVELAVGSGSGYKWNEADGEQVRRVYPSPSSPLITFDEKPDGA